jgi:hypothetical protein
VPTLKLVQLPVPPPAAFAATGNVPLAAGTLGVAARVSGLDRRLSIEVVPPAVTDRLGDAALADEVARGEPELVGFSLYLWNVERSLHLAREVKRRSPRTRVLIGGPEVSADNPFVLGQSGFDLAVTGEAEATFTTLLAKLLDGEPATGMPGVAVRGPLGVGPFGSAAPADFPLTTYPSPYLDGVLPVERSRSTYVETVRGCRSHCTFCFYPRSSSVLRVLDVERSAALVRDLKERGAREVVFLDPTFNHRPGFDDLLDALIDVNADRGLTFFAEVRAEGLTAAHAQKLARAGFDRLEIGLQSVNARTLKAVRRGGNPEKVSTAAKMLHDAGIELLVDLIVGLPGDTVEDVAHGVDWLQVHDLGDEAQVFPLSLLPGTAMRATAEQDGVVYDPAPPYRVRHTAEISEEAWKGALRAAETQLGRRLDEVPRPHLAEAASSDGPPDVVHVDLDAGAPLPSIPGAPHLALWLEARNLDRHRKAILTAIDARLAADPYSTLDVILCSPQPFSPELAAAVRAHVDAAPASYLTRVLAHRGENLMRRVVVVVPRGADVSPGWIDDVRRHVRVFREQTLARALLSAGRHGKDQPGARIVDRIDPVVDDDAVRALASTADTDEVIFADRAAEIAWQHRMLGFGDADR